MSQFWTFVNEINFKNLKDIDDNELFVRSFEKKSLIVKKNYTQEEINQLIHDYEFYERQLADKYYKGTWHDQTLDALSFVIAEGEHFYKIINQMENLKLGDKLIHLLYKRYKHEINFYWLFLK